MGTPARRLLSGYLSTPPSSDAVVVRAARPPRVVRKARLRLCILEGDRLDATPLGRDIHFDPKAYRPAAYRPQRTFRGCGQRAATTSN
ncbi:hypothetical protein ILP97_24885 [Amycolatopsis sp. H6(2020)]|nr:hypothetical protein [Amycolatopsis sp. H6(2020)]